MPNYQSRPRGRNQSSRGGSAGSGGSGNAAHGTGNSATATRLGLDGGSLAQTVASGVILKLGATGSAVIELQDALGVQPTAVFDQATAAAVRRFQLAHSLGVDGAVGPTTLAALTTVARNQAAAPKGAELLFQVTTTGASRATARQDKLPGGTAASEKMARTDKSRILAMKDVFIEVGDKYGLPPSVLAAIASRETRGGNLLNKEGFSRYDGNGFGVMQVDKRYHKVEGDARGREHVEQAAQILARYRDQLADKFPDWTEAMILRGAVAAYNTGPGDVRSYSDVDRRTTGGDYSADVWVRARSYAPEFGDRPT